MMLFLTVPVEPSVKRMGPLKPQRLWATVKFKIRLRFMHQDCSFRPLGPRAKMLFVITTLEKGPIGVVGAKCNCIPAPLFMHVFSVNVKSLSTMWGAPVPVVKAWTQSMWQLLLLGGELPESMQFSCNAPCMKLRLTKSPFPETLQ